ncbi:MAG: di-trans,poly-cis-decaprenylcistransferase [Elusimicrobia bacterium]|nr:di-trans,poly-cis-decaprenylcistransferase [Elusimicrobiota bacterium]
MPRHVAVIMDGNGRWAAARGLPRIAGHKAGVESVRRIVRAAGELGVEALTLYSFSTENWLRPAEEVGELMRLLSWALDKETLELDKNRVRLGAIGRLEALPAAVRDHLAKSIERLKGNAGLRLTLALNYGGRQEIVDAANKALAAGAKTLDEDALSRHLYTAGLPDLDLVIRTSGEMRLSNFLLWQAAYAELHVTPVLWPDFRKEHLQAALADYAGRDRRFGGLSPKA